MTSSMCRVLIILVNAGKLWTRQCMSVSSQYYLDMTYNPVPTLSAITYDQFVVQSANNIGRRWKLWTGQHMSVSTTF